MLVRCNQSCKLKDGSTTGSLDVESDEVICDYCDEVLEGISSFAKRMMQSNGDIVRRSKKKAFQFSCETCNKEVETILKNDEVVGSNCIKGECKFNISSFAIHAMKMVGRDKPQDEEDV